MQTRPRAWTAKDSGSYRRLRLTHVKPPSRTGRQGDEPAPLMTDGALSLSDSVAVIDIGSNSGRVVVYQRDPTGDLRAVAGSRASLRLVEDVDRRGELTESTMARLTEALRDFKAIAMGAGAGRIIAVDTAAMRDASNGALFAERLERELGIGIEIISGEAEARYGFDGAMRGLAVSGGLLFDVGGGSMELTRFHSRRREDDVRSSPWRASFECEVPRGRSTEAATTSAVARSHSPSPDEGWCQAAVEPRLSRR